MDWTSQPNPNHPDSEALVRCRLRVSGPRDDAPAARGPVIAEHRAAVTDILDVTWRLNTVAAVQVHPHSPSAEDALDVFRHTVDGFLDRMVYLDDETDLRDAPDGTAVTRLRAGTLVLRQEDRDAWAFVRVPSDTLAGWIPADLLRQVARLGAR